MSSIDLSVDSMNSAKLNLIATDWDPETGLPTDGVSDKVATICAAIDGQLDDRIDQLATNTLFTRREAQVWALNCVYPDRDGLTLEAIALYLSTRSDEDVVTVDTVEDLRTRAFAKYMGAVKTVGTVTAPDRAELVTRLTPVWVDDRTVTRLNARAEAADQTFADVITRVLDQSRTTIPLEEVVARYRDTTQPAEIAVPIRPIQQDTDRLPIVVHIPDTTPSETPPSPVDGVHGVTVGGEEYDFHTVEVTSNAHLFNRITVFAAETNEQLAAVSAAEGIATLEQRLTEVELPLEDLVERSLADCSATRVLVNPRKPKDELAWDIVVEVPESMFEDPPDPNWTGRFDHVAKVLVDGTAYDVNVRLSDTTDKNVDDWLPLATADNSQSLTDGLNQLRTRLQTQNDASATHH